MGTTCSSNLRFSKAAKKDAKLPPSEINNCLGNDEDFHAFSVLLDRFTLRGRVGNGVYEVFINISWAGHDFSTSSVSSTTGKCEWEENFSFNAKLPSTVFKVADDDSRSHYSKISSNSEEFEAEELFVVKCMARNLKSKSLTFHELGSIEVPIEVMASGPAHHDFSLTVHEKASTHGFLLDSSGASEVRLGYNCRIVEEAEWTMQLSDLSVRYSNEEKMGAQSTTQRSVPLSPKRKAIVADELNEVDLLDQPVDVVDQGKFYVVVYRISRPDIRNIQGDLQFQSLTERAPKLVHKGTLTYHEIVWTKPELSKIDVTGSFQSLLSGTMRIQVFSCKKTKEKKEILLAKSMKDINENFESEVSYDLNQLLSEHTKMASQNEFPRFPSHTSMLLQNVDGGISTQNPTMQLVGECWVPMSRMYDEIFDSGNGNDTVSDLDLSDSGSDTDKSLKKRSNSKFKLKYQTATFKQELWLLGKRVGSILGQITFENIPIAMQLPTGVFSEKGVATTSSVIVGSGAADGQQNGPNGTIPVGWRLVEFLRNWGVQQGLPPIGRELALSAQQLHRLMSARARKTLYNKGKDLSIEDKRIQTATRILYLLQTTQKESMWSYVYSDTASLESMQRVMGSLWLTILEWFSAGSYALRLLFFEILFRLLKRAELGELLLPTQQEVNYLVDFRSKHGANAKLDNETLQRKIDLGMEYRDLMYKTLGYALHRLNVKGSYDALRLFCARIVAVMCFRIPSFGERVYDAIMPMDETNVEEWRDEPELVRTQTPSGGHFKVPEWRSTEFSLDTPTKSNRDTPLKLSDRAGKRKKRKRRNLRSQRKSSKSGDPTLALLDWTNFHAVLESEFSEGELRAQEEALPKAKLVYNEVTKESSKLEMWYNRLKKHGFLYFSICQQWIIYVLNTVGILTNARVTVDQDVEVSSTEGLISWWTINGYKKILKSFLLELRRRPISQIPESMRKLSMLFLFDCKLLTPFVKIVLNKTNVHDIASVGASLDLISSWFATVHSWPGRLRAEKIFRRFGPVTSEQAAYYLLNEKMGPSTFTSVSRDSGTNKPVTSPKTETSSTGSASPLQKFYAVDRANNPDSSAITGDDSGAVSAWDFDEISLYMPTLDMRPFHKDTIDVDSNEFAQNLEASWTRHLYNRPPPPLPAAFDFKMLLQAFWICWHSDYFQVVLKITEIVFQHWDAFPVHFQHDIRTMIVSNFPDPFLSKTDAGATDAGKAGPNYSELEEMHNSFKEKRPPHLHLEESSMSLDETDETLHSEESHPLFVRLFYHWSSEVRNFFQILLEFRLLRPARWRWMEKSLDPKHKGNLLRHILSQDNASAVSKILAVARILEHSHSSPFWEVIWHKTKHRTPHHSQPEELVLFRRQHVLDVQLSRSLNLALKTDAFDDEEAAILSQHSGKMLLNKSELSEIEQKIHAPNSPETKKSKMPGSPWKRKSKHVPQDAGDAVMARRQRVNSLNMKHVDSIKHVLEKRVFHTVPGHKDIRPRLQKKVSERHVDHVEDNASESSTQFVKFLKHESKSDLEPADVKLGSGIVEPAELPRDETDVMENNEDYYSLDRLHFDFNLLGLDHLPTYLEPYAAMATTEFYHIQELTDLPIMEWNTVVLHDKGGMQLVGSAGLLESDRKEQKLW